MKKNKLSIIVLCLTLVAVIAVGTSTAFAADETEAVNMQTPVTVTTPETAPTQEILPEAKDIPAPEEITEDEDKDAAKETAPAQESAPEGKDVPVQANAAENTPLSEKGKTTFPGIDAIAAEVLGVSEESLAGLNHADELYAKLTEAGKVDGFKTALIDAKQEWIQAKVGSGKFTAEAMEEKLGRIAQSINDWDGTTELKIGFFKK